MAGGFKTGNSLTRDEHDWGVFAQISGPRDGLAGIVAIEATFLPGKCHDFHRHPGQEEVIYVVEGTIEQWLEQEKLVLSAGDSVMIPASAVHATFNDGAEAARDPRDPLPGGRRRRLRRRGRRRRRALGVVALMQAIRVHEGGELRHETVPDPEPGPGEVLVELRVAALNRRDVLVAQGTYPYPLPLVPGSDGAGVRRDTGEEVVINPALGWGESEAAFGPDFQILGGPRDGTYAELVVVPEVNLSPKPARLSWEEAAALPLAGVTAYRALFSRGGLRAGETVLVLGAGSGVSTFAVQLAAQAGATVLVTSSSDEKLERSQALGAEAGVNYVAADWVAWAKERGGVDLVIDSVGSTWPQSLECLRPGGRVVVFGATGGTEVTLPVRPFYFGQWSLLGTMMGSPADFAGLLAALERGSWQPVIDSVRPLAEAAQALETLESGAHFGKLVLEV